MGDILVLDGFLHYGGAVLADLSYDTDIFEASEGIVHQETLGKAGVEAGEVVVLSRNSRGSTRVHMEDLTINPFRGIHTALDHRDAFIEDVANIGAGLGATPSVEVANGVAVGVGDVVFHPLSLDNALGVIFIAFTLQGIFYCHYVTK